MDILIHPSYFPSISHFVAMIQADKITFEMEDNFQKQTNRNRMYIYGANGIEEQLKQGKTVVSDRYFFSSLAYQSVSCGKELPRLLNSPFPLPEYLFYFKIDPEISLKRVDTRNGKKEIYEKIDIQKKIAKLYDEVIEEYQQKSQENEMKIITIDASKSIDQVFAEIKKHLN